MSPNGSVHAKQGSIDPLQKESIIRRLTLVVDMF